MAQMHSSILEHDGRETGTLQIWLFMMDAKLERCKFGFVMMDAKLERCKFGFFMMDAGKIYNHYK